MSADGNGGFFSRFGKRQLVLTSPVVGTSIRIEDVPDQVFSAKMLGEGAAFIFEGDTVHAPCDGKVIVVASTKHAIGFAVKDVEILLHVGLDTVNLKGQGFTALVSEGDRVKRGQSVLKLDRELLAALDADLTTMMVITSQPGECVVHEPATVTLESPSISF